MINLCVNFRYLTDSSRERWDFSLKRTHAEGLTKKYLAVLFTFWLREWILLAVLREQWPAASSGYDSYVFCVFFPDITSRFSSWETKLSSEADETQLLGSVGWRNLWEKDLEKDDILESQQHLAFHIFTFSRQPR